jgi:hypothetical protein
MGKTLEFTTVAPTAAGMHALWDVAAFDKVDGYDAWADELEDDADIERHIKAGHFVPIYIHGDGVFCITVRADGQAMPALTSDEEQRVVARSAVYRLTTSGRIAVSGIEHVGPVDARVPAGQLEPGDYDVVVHLMDYDDVPSRGDDHPDFVVTVGPPLADAVSVTIETFAPQQ